MEVSFKDVGSTVENPCWKHIVVDALTVTKVLTLVFNLIKYTPFISFFNLTILKTKKNILVVDYHVGILNSSDI